MEALTEEKAKVHIVGLPALVDVEEQMILGTKVCLASFSHEVNFFYFIFIFL